MLSGPFCWHLRLCVDVQSDPTRSVTQQFLHNLDVFSIRLQESRVGASECVPADSLLNTKIPHNRLDVVAHDG